MPALAAPLALILALACASGLAPREASAQNGKPPDLNAEAVLLLDSGGRVLFAKNADDEHAPASLVKLMTLYLAYEDVEAGRVAWEEPVTVSAKAAATPAYRLGLRTGETVPLALLLEGVAVVSANDAATAVAERLNGDEQEFVARMNAKARQLGLTATQFANPHGLPDPNQRSTAKDLATLTASLLERFPEVRTLLGAKSFAYRGRAYARRNPLLRAPWGVQALKTGFTREAGYNLAVAAWRHGQHFLAILLGAKSRGLSFLDAQKLLQYGFVQGGLEPVAKERRPPRRRSGARRPASPPS